MKKLLVMSTFLSGVVFPVESSSISIKQLEEKLEQTFTQETRECFSSVVRSDWERAIVEGISSKTAKQIYAIFALNVSDDESINYTGKETIIGVEKTWGPEHSIKDTKYNSYYYGSNYPQTLALWQLLHKTQHKII